MDSTYFPYKSFSQAAHDANDLPAKLAVSGWLAAKGWQVYQSGQYDVDFSCRRPDGSVCHLEVERRSWRGWTGEFPFPDLQLPLRKREWLGDPHLVFWVANRDLSRWAAVPGPVVAEVGGTLDKSIAGRPDRFLTVPVEYVRQGRL